MHANGVIGPHYANDKIVREVYCSQMLHINVQ